MMVIIWFAKMSQNKPKYVCWYTNVSGMEERALRTHSHRPDTIVPTAANFYNKHKGGTDTSDHLVKNVCADHRNRHAYVAKGILVLLQF
jgi:hypothetical protein